MPSPFPGMDPYLEDPRLWPDVHHGLISEMQAALNRLVRPRYSVRVEERIYVSDEADPGRDVLIPDLSVTREGTASHPASPPAWSGPRTERGPIILTTCTDIEIREARLEILDVRRRQVVTVIEVSSPSNKRPGSRGRASFEEKRREVLRSSSHWVEIDLLRFGEGFLRRGDLPRADYYVHVSRAQDRPKGLVWAMRMEDALPTIPIPLRVGEAETPLALQAVLRSVYDRGAYDLEVDYQAEPTPPLTASRRRWAAALLAAKGLRPKSPRPRGGGHRTSGGGTLEDPRASPRPGRPGRGGRPAAPERARRSAVRRRR